MKVEKYFIFFAIFLLSVSIASASIEDKINSIVVYAEQYEVGQMSYLQMVVHSNAVREEIESLLGERYDLGDHDQRRGLSEAAARKLFGKPIEKTRWVWDVIEDKEIKLDEPMPRWEKIVFDGRKIQISFNAWPQVLTQEGELIKFYGVDFDTRFKQDFDFDVDQMVDVIKNYGENYLESGSNGEELIEKMVEYRSAMQSYLDQNRENCKYIVEQFFDKDEKTAEQKKISWSSPLFNGFLKNM